MKKTILLCAALMLLLALVGCSAVARSMSGASSDLYSSAVSAMGGESSYVRERSEISSGVSAPDSSAVSHSSASSGLPGLQSEESSRALDPEAIRSAFEQAGFSVTQGDDPDTWRITHGNTPAYYELRFCISEADAAEAVRTYEKNGQKALRRGSVVIAYPEDLESPEEILTPFESMW